MEPTTPTPPQTSMETPASHAKKPTVNRKLVQLTVVLAVVALVVAGLMGWVAMSNKAEEETPTASVSITGSGYTPATIKVKKGQDITWTNNDVKAHQIVGDQGSPSGFKSEEALNKGDSYSFTFEDIGTFHYHDSANIALKGVVIVE